MITIRSKPYDFKLDPERTALVVIDMQRDFIEPGGFGASLGNEVSRLEGIIPTVGNLIGLFRKKGWPIVHTRENHAGDLSDCPPSKRRRGEPGSQIGDTGPMGRILIRGEPGAEIISALAPARSEIVIDKPGKGMFWATPVHDVLRERGITHLVFSGVTTEVCVQTSMREANDRGFECLLIEDATESYFPEFKTATIAMLVAQGGIVGCATPFAELERAL
jgi:biuret amidohydrolase